MVTTNRRRVIALCSYIIMRRRRNQRWWWVRPILQRRREQGDYHNLVQELRQDDPEGFFNYFRMSVTQFDYLVSMVSPVIGKRNSRFRESISAEQRLAVTLRFLASGDSMVSLSYAFRLGRSTVSLVIRDALEALWQILQPLYLPHANVTLWEKTAEGFKNKWQFPNCIGAMDGKHIVLQAPNSSGSMFFNYKGGFSIVLMAVADAHCRFIYVDIGASGSQSDGDIFSSSSLGKMLQAQRLGLPEPAPLETGASQKMPFVFVADEAFPLRLNIMRPFPGRQLDTEKRIFNYRLSRARRCIENAFGIMASRFRVFRRPITTSVDTAERIVKAAVCLHNFLKQEDDLVAVNSRRYCPPGYEDFEDSCGNLCSGSWRDMMSCMHPISRVSSNSYGFAPATTRNLFCNYFNNEGAVPWQLRIVSMSQ